MHARTKPIFHYNAKLLALGAALAPNASILRCQYQHLKSLADPTRAPMDPSRAGGIKVALGPLKGRTHTPIIAASADVGRRSVAKSVAKSADSGTRPTATAPIGAWVCISRPTQYSRPTDAERSSADGQYQTCLIFHRRRSRATEDAFRVDQSDGTLQSRDFRQT